MTQPENKPLPSWIINLSTKILSDKERLDFIEAWNKSIKERERLIYDAGLKKFKL